MSEEVRQREVAEGKIDIQNVIASYLIDLIEYRASLLTSLKRNINSPTYPKEFFKSFNKLYELCANVLTDEHKELMTSIREWFETTKLMGSKAEIEKGIELSIEFQRALETESIFTLFERPIVPPFLRGEEK